jgi:hypothetical protein
VKRLLIVGGAIVAAALLFVVLRPDDDGDNTRSAPTTTASTAPTTTVPPPPPAPPPPARISIVVKGGRPVGGVRSVTVAEGRRIVLTVTADVTDEVHLHGYNVKRDVAPGKPARLAFRATIVGTVEVELEGSGVPLAHITTQP